VLGCLPRFLMFLVFLPTNLFLILVACCVSCFRRLMVKPVFLQIITSCNWYRCFWLRFRLDLKLPFSNQKNYMQNLKQLSLIIFMIQWFQISRLRVLFNVITSTKITTFAMRSFLCFRANTNGKLAQRLTTAYLRDSYWNLRGRLSFQSVVFLLSNECT